MRVFFPLVLYYLNICCICSVAMILELKILTKNMKAYMYACAKFQEHSERDVEDTSLSFSVFVCVFFLLKTA